MRANTAAVKKNMEAADRLGDNLNALSNATVALPFDTFVNAVKTYQQRQPRSERDLDALERSGIAFEWVDVMKEFGLTVSNVDAIIEATGIAFDSIARDADALLVAIANFKTFNRDFGLLQKQFALFDIEGPGEKFASVMDLLAAQVSDGFAAVLEGLTPENFDAFLEEFLSDLSAFPDDLLDGLDFDQFLTGIGFAESALDGLATETDKATAALRNAPAGFKVALARFTASDPRPPIPLPTSSVFRTPPLRHPPTDHDFGKGPSFTEEIQRLTKALSEGQGESTQTITIENVTMHGVNDPRELLSKLEDEVEWRARTGASVIPSKNEMRL